MQRAQHGDGAVSRVRHHYVKRAVAWWLVGFEKWGDVIAQTYGAPIQRDEPDAWGCDPWATEDPPRKAA